MNAIVEVMACATDAFLGMWFIARFHRCSFLRNPVSWIFFTFHLIFNTVNLYVSSHLLVSTAINLLLLMTYSVLLRSGTTVRKVVAPFVFEGLLALVNVFLAFLLAALLQVEVSALVTGGGVVRVLSLAICKLVLWALLLLILRIFADRERFLLQDYFLLLLFPCALFFELTILVKIALAYSVSHLYAYFIAALFLLVISNFGIYYLVYRIKKSNRERLKLELAAQTQGFEERRYRDSMEILNRTHHMRHDIKNQLLLVRMQLDSQNIENASIELNRILENVENVGDLVTTNHQVADYIVNTKLANLKDRIVVVTGLIDTCEIEDMDLSILLGNMLDNAIEATEGIKGARIELRFFRKDYYLNILCRNSISSSVLKENPKLKSTKKNKEQHGFGTRSMREVVKRHNGMISFFEEEGMFCVHIMLPLAGMQNP